MSKATRASGAAALPVLLGFSTTVLSALKLRLERSRDRRSLSAFDDFMLKDIGLSRADLFQAVPELVKQVRAAKA